MKRLGAVAVAMPLITGSGYLAACSRNTNATTNTSDRGSRAPVLEAGRRELNRQEAQQSAWRAV